MRMLAAVTIAVVSFPAIARAQDVAALQISVEGRPRAVHLLEGQAASAGAPTQCTSPCTLPVAPGPFRLEVGSRRVMGVARPGVTPVHVRPPADGQYNAGVGIAIAGAGRVLEGAVMLGLAYGGSFGLAGMIPFFAGVALIPVGGIMMIVGGALAGTAGRWRVESMSIASRGRPQRRGPTLVGAGVVPVAGGAVATVGLTF